MRQGREGGTERERSEREMSEMKTTARRRRTKKRSGTRASKR